MNKTSKFLAGFVIFAMVVAFFIAMPYLKQAEGSDPTDSGLSAAIKFVDPSTGRTISEANILHTGSFLSPGLARMTVLDQSGNDISDANLVAQLNGKAITAGVPVRSWSITGTMTITIDNRSYSTYSIAKAGTGAPPQAIQLDINGSPELQIAVSELQSFWGVYSYGQHNLAIGASATLNVNFEDDGVISKNFNNAFLATASFQSSSDATASFEVSSNYNTAGSTTTTTPTTTTVTDTWANGGTADYDLERDIQKVGMKISDSARFGKNVTSVKIQLKAGSSTALSTSKIVATIRTLTTDQLIATSTTSINGRIATTGNYVFEFPIGSKVPDAPFWVGLECQNCGNSNNAWVYTVPGNPYNAGNVRNYAGDFNTPGSYFWSEISTNDLEGSITYKVS